MLPKSCVLTPDRLHDIFPFHLSVDADLKIVQTGKTLTKILGRDVTGHQLEQEFSIARPRLKLEFNAITRKKHQLFFLDYQHSPLKLKGQVFILIEGEMLVFLCSPWADSLTSISELGIKLRDYAVHDSIIDYLFLQNTHQTALADLKDINSQLLGKQAELEASLKEQERLTRSYEEQLQRSNSILEKLKQTQSQLLQAEKMSALGSLSAGVAHEINNPTSFLAGNIPHAQEYFHDLINIIELYQAAYPSPANNIATQLKKLDFEFIKTDLPKLLNSMHIGTERIAEIVKSLQSFSRTNEAEVKPVNIHDGLDSTLTILNNRLKAVGDRPAINVVKQYADLPPIECYAGSLNQVFMNLMVNALDALETRAEAHQSRIAPPEDAHASEQKKSMSAVWEPTLTIQTQILENTWVRAIVQDNGNGISERVKSRIFEPFFTTKGVGKGTGLGMSISYQIIVDQHGGKLYFESQPDIGTCFIVELPIHHNVAERRGD